MTQRLGTAMCLLLVLLTANAVRADFVDYSARGGDYAVLRGIRLDVRGLTFTGKRQVRVRGQPIEAFVFTCSATVNVQTKESYAGVPEDNLFEDLGTDFEILVASDTTHAAHDLLIEDIYQFWSTHKLDNSVISDLNVNWGAGGQLVFDGIVPKLVWFDNKIVQINFLKFQDAKKFGLGAEQDFWENKIRFFYGKDRIKMEWLQNGRQREFLDLYSKGFFRLKH